LYVYTQASDSNTVPVVGSIANSYVARAGIGSARIWLFQASAYYGHQGTAVDGDGKAGGDIYGGVLNFFPTDQWNMKVSVDRVRNLSDISEATNIGLAGLAFAAVPVATSASVQATTITGQTNYQLSQQTSLYASVSDVHTSFFNSPIVETSWYVAAGVTYQATDNLSLKLTYGYSRFYETTPNSNFTGNVVTLGSHYNF
jgi:opacity protein-like surface antigen